MVKVSDIIKPEDADNVITIGGKDDEKYLETILHKFTTSTHVYIKVISKDMKALMKVKLYYHYFKFMAVREMERKKVLDVDRADPTKYIEVTIARWEQIVRVKKYREEEKEYLEGESVL